MRSHQAANLLHKTENVAELISSKINSLTMQNATGVYMVQIQTAEEVINKKVVLN